MNRDLKTYEDEEECLKAKGQESSGKEGNVLFNYALNTL